MHTLAVHALTYFDHASRLGTTKQAGTKKGGKQLMTGYDKINQVWLSGIASPYDYINILLCLREGSTLFSLSLAQLPGQVAPLNDARINLPKHVTSWRKPLSFCRQSLNLRRQSLNDTKCCKSQWRLFIPFLASLLNFAFRFGNQLLYWVGLSKSAAINITGRRHRPLQLREHVENLASTVRTSESLLVKNVHGTFGHAWKATLYR